MFIRRKAKFWRKAKLIFALVHGFQDNFNGAQGIPEYPGNPEYPGTRVPGFPISGFGYPSRNSYTGMHTRCCGGKVLAGNDIDLSLYVTTDSEL